MMRHAMAARAVAFWQQAAPAAPGPMTDQQFRQQIALEAVRHNAGHGAVSILVPLGFFALVFVILWLALRYKQAKIQARAELHKQLLDKFGSGQEFAAFLESKGSQKFLDELGSYGNSARDQMLRSLRIGVVFSLVGLGMLGLALAARGERGVLFLAVVFLSVGIGFLIVTLIAYRLSKRWGQIPESGAMNPQA